MFSIQQGHFLSDAPALNLKKKKKKKNYTAQCTAVSASDLSARGHQWYIAGIWDKIITALALIEVFILGVIRPK